MSERKDGGPAFPINGWEGPNDLRIWPEPGMTLRDWFAGQAYIADVQFPTVRELAAFVGEPEPTSLDEGYTERMLAIAAKAQAKMRYLVADAMLAARTALEKNNG